MTPIFPWDKSGELKVTWNECCLHKLNTCNVTISMKKSLNGQGNSIDTVLQKKFIVQCHGFAATNSIQLKWFSMGYIPCNSHRKKILGVYLTWHLCPFCVHLPKIMWRNEVDRLYIGNLFSVLFSERCGLGIPNKWPYNTFFYLLHYWTTQGQKILLKC